MAGITKQKRSYMNKPIGVTRFETGETQMWESVANAATTLNQIALKEGSKQAEQSGLDAAMAIDQSQIIAFDAETGKPRALDPKVMSGGIIARDAYKRTVAARFRDSIELELKSKASELQVKYKNQPELFREEMSRYVGEMHKNAEGKWKETIKVGGVAITRAVELNIQEQRINLENEKLVSNLQGKMNTFLTTGMYNNYEVFSPEKANANNGNEYNQILLEIKDAEEIGIIEQGSSKEFEQNYLVSSVTFAAQNDLAKGLIQLDNLNAVRTNLVLAFKTGNGNLLPKDSTEYDIYQKINKLANGNKTILKQVGNNLVDTLTQVNSISIQNSNSLTAKGEVNGKNIISASNVKGDMLLYQNSIDFNESFDEELKLLDNLKRTSENLLGNSDVSIKRKTSAESNAKEFTQNLYENLVQRLIISTEGSKNRKKDIQDIRSALNKTLSEEAIEKSNLNDFQKNILNKISLHNLSKDSNVARFFSNELDSLAYSSATKIKNQSVKATKIMTNISQELFGKSYLESEIIVKNHINKLNKGGDFSELAKTTSGEKYKNNLNSALIVRSLSEIEFSYGSEGLREINAALTYIKRAGISDDLANDLELKEHIDRTTKINGANPQAYQPFFIQFKAIKNAEIKSEEAINKNNVTKAQLEQGQSNSDTTKYSQNLLNNILKSSNISLEDAFFDPMGTEKYPDVFKTTGQLLELNQKLPELNAIVNNLFTGRLNEEQSAFVLNKLMILNNKQDAEDGSNMNLLKDALDGEKFGQYQFMARLVTTSGVQNAQEFANAYRAATVNPEWNEQYNSEIGNTKKWLDNNGFEDIANDANARAIIEPYLKLSFFRNQNIDNLENDVQEILDDIYVETIDNVVTDHTLSNSTRSLGALQKVFPNIDVRNALYDAVEAELPPNSSLGTRGIEITESINPTQSSVFAGQAMSGTSSIMGLALTEVITDTSGKRTFKYKGKDLREFTLIPIVRGDNDYIYVVYEKTNLGLKIHRPEKFDEFGDSERKAIAFSSNEPFLLDARAKAYSELNTLTQEEIDTIANTRNAINKNAQERIRGLPTPSEIFPNISNVDDWAIETFNKGLEFMNKKRNIFGTDK